MFVQLSEVFDMSIMILVIGFIFMDSFKIKKTDEDVLTKYMKNNSIFNWPDFWFAAMVVAPAIILHEVGHKVTALSFGLTATFHAAYFWLILALVLKLVRFPLIFFVPAFVAISGSYSAGESSLIAFMGPGVNLILFLIALIVLKTKKRMKVKEIHFWSLTKNINAFLLVFNLIPIPGFDGFTFFSGLWKIFGF